MNKCWVVSVLLNMHFTPYLTELSYNLQVLMYDLSRLLDIVFIFWI